MTDAMPSLRCFALRAAGVITMTEGLTSWRRSLNSVGNALPTSATTKSLDKMGGDAYTWRAEEQMYK